MFWKVELQVGKLIHKIDEREEISWVFLLEWYKNMRCVKMLTRVVCFRVLHPNSTLQVSSQVSLLIQLQLANSHKNYMDFCSSFVYNVCANLCYVYTCVVNSFLP